MENDLWYVYLVRCSDGTFYTGITTDLKRRVNEHNNSDLKGARYTRTRRPVKVIYHEVLHGRGEATLREREIKKMTKANKQRLAANNSSEGTV